MQHTSPVSPPAMFGGVVCGFGLEKRGALNLCSLDGEQVVRWLLRWFCFWIFGKKFFSFLVFVFEIKFSCKNLKIYFFCLNKLDLFRIRWIDPWDFPITLNQKSPRTIPREGKHSRDEENSIYIFSS